jgi:hypothetical protein
MENNKAIVVALENVRPHPNADRLKLATVVGDQVVVGLDAKDGDIMIYFDSNLRLSHYYLNKNNLYQNAELNADPTQKGYFGKNGRVRAQQFRGSMSHGFVADLNTLGSGAAETLVAGDTVTHIGTEMICEKFVVPKKHLVPKKHRHARAGVKKTRLPVSRMFWKHWDTKHLLRDCFKIPTGPVYIEEKIHGTSGRTGKVLVPTPWWNFWVKEEWKTVSGTRRVDNTDYHLRVDNTDYHLREIRDEIHKKLAPHVRKGEQLYYEIFGKTKTNCPPCGTNHGTGGVCIQPLAPYGCQQGKYRVILYRVTISTVDGHCYDLSRKAVYQRAQQLGLEAPPFLGKALWDKEAETLSHLDAPFFGSGQWYDYTTLHELKEAVKGKSTIADDTLLEGIVVWFEDAEGKWDCLKLKSDEFLLQEDGLREKGVEDAEDTV